MAFVKPSKNSLNFGVTPVDNLFVLEFMPAMTGDYVKVYLAALLQCRYTGAAEPSMERFAAGIGLDTSVVLDAMKYFVRMGLAAPLKGDASRFELLDVRSAMSDDTRISKERTLYRYAEFNARLQELTKGRQPTHTEYEKIYSWIETFGFTEGAILAVLEHAVAEYGPSKATAAKMAPVVRSLKNKGITDERAVRNELAGYALSRSPAKQLLAHLGISHRNPTKDEHDAYIKWRDEWGFSPDAIINACSEMMKIREPNVFYLDKVLKTLHDEGLTTTDSMDAAHAAEAADKETLWQFARALGVHSIKRDFMHFYRAWQKGGLTDEAALLLCDAAAGAGLHTFKEADAFITDFVKRGVTNTDAIRNDLRLADDTAQVMRAAGLKRAVTQADKDMIQRLLLSLPFEVVMEGASMSRDATKPMAYLNALCAKWQGEGVKTVAEARVSYEKGKPKDMGKPKDTRNTMQVEGNSSFSAEDIEKRIERF